METPSELHPRVLTAARVMCDPSRADDKDLDPCDRHKLLAVQVLRAVMRPVHLHGGIAAYTLGLPGDALELEP